MDVTRLRCVRVLGEGAFGKAGKAAKSGSSEGKEVGCDGYPAWETYKKLLKMTIDSEFSH